MSTGSGKGGGGRRDEGRGSRRKRNQAPEGPRGTDVSNDVNVSVDTKTSEQYTNEDRRGTSTASDTPGIDSASNGRQSASQKTDSDNVLMSSNEDQNEGEYFDETAEETASQMTAPDEGKVSLQGSAEPGPEASNAKSSDPSSSIENSPRAKNDKGENTHVFLQSTPAEEYGGGTETDEGTSDDSEDASGVESSANDVESGDAKFEIGESDFENGGNDVDTDGDDAQSGVNEVDSGEKKDMSGVNIVFNGGNEEISDGNEVSNDGNEIIEGNDVIDGGNEVISYGNEVESGRNKEISNENDVESGGNEEISNGKDIESGGNEFSDGNDIESGGNENIIDGNDIESGGNKEISEGNDDESGENEINVGNVVESGGESLVSGDGVETEEKEPMQWDDETQNEIDLNAGTFGTESDDNAEENARNDFDDYSDETYEDSEESNFLNSTGPSPDISEFTPEDSGESPDSSSGWKSNPPQRDSASDAQPQRGTGSESSSQRRSAFGTQSEHQSTSNTPSERKSTSSTPSQRKATDEASIPPERLRSSQGQMMSEISEKIDETFRPSRPEGKREGEYEEEIAERKEESRRSRVPSEAGSVRSDRLISYGNDAIFPPKKEMAAGDKHEEKIPPPPNDEEPYIPIHPLLANYLPTAWFKELESLEDCACKTPLFNAIYQLANVIRSKTSEIKEINIKNENLKQTNAKVIAELRKWSQASSFFEQSQIKLEAELHKTNLQRDDLKKKLEGQTLLLDKFRDQLKLKQAEISTEHVAFGDLERELEFTQREVILRDKNIEKLEERVAAVEKERAVEAEKRRQASSRVSDLETEMVALEAKHAKSNVLNEAIAAKQKAEASSRIAHENLNALQQEYQRLLHTTKNDGDYNTELVNKINKLMGKNESLEKELGQLRCEANCQIINLNKDKNKINAEYQKLTRERLHLDTTIADLKASNGLLRHEREASKSDLATLRSRLDEAVAQRKDEKIRSNVVVTKLAEELKALKKKLVDLESKSGNEDLLKKMLENKGKELAQLQSQTDEKLSLLTSSMKCSTENLHAQIEALKAALLRKAEELQRLKFEHGDTIELEPIGISFHKQKDGSIKVIEGPGVSREAELKNVINEMTKQLEAVRKDNKRLKDLLKSTEDECDCLQNCFKENTVLEKHLEYYRKIIQEMMSQSKSLTRTAREMGFFQPGHSTKESFIKDKEAIKRTLIQGASGPPSTRASRSGVASGDTSGAPSRGEPNEGELSRPGSPRRTASRSEFGGDGGDGSVGSYGEDANIVVDKLVKLDDAVNKAMAARDDQLRSALRRNMEDMGLKDDVSVLNIQEFQDENVDYLAELETVFYRAKELADLAEEYRLRVVALEIECAKTEAELDHYKELELTLIEKGVIDGDYLQKIKADVIDVLKPEPEQIVDMDHFLEEQQQMLRDKVAKECASRSDLVDALKNQFLNEAKEIHNELEILRQKLIEKEKEVQEKGFRRSGYLDQEAKWHDEMPPPADAVGYRDPNGGWRETSTPPQKPGYFDAAGNWRDEVPDPNVAGYVNDGGNFVQAPLVEPEMAQRMDADWRWSNGALKEGGGGTDGGGTDNGGKINGLVDVNLGGGATAASEEVVPVGEEGVQRTQPAGGTDADWRWSNGAREEGKVGATAAGEKGLTAVGGIVVDDGSLVDGSRGGPGAEPQNAETGYDQRQGGGVDDASRVGNVGEFDPRNGGAGPDQQRGGGGSEGGGQNEERSASTEGASPVGEEVGIDRYPERDRDPGDRQSHQSRAVSFAGDQSRKNSASDVDSTGRASAGDQSRKNSTADVDGSKGGSSSGGSRNPSAKSSAVSFDGAASTRLSKTQEDSASVKPPKSGKTFEINEEAEQFRGASKGSFQVVGGIAMPKSDKDQMDFYEEENRKREGETDRDGASRGVLQMVGGIAMAKTDEDQLDFFEEKEKRRIEAMLKKSAELYAEAEEKEKKEIAEAQEAQRWSSQVLHKRLKGAYRCFMSYWESLGGIPDCSDPCDQVNQDQAPSPARGPADDNENENRRRRHSISRRKKSGERNRSSSRKRSSSRPKESSQRQSTSRRCSPSGRRDVDHQRSIGRNAGPSRPGKIRSSPVKKSNPSHRSSASDRREVSHHRSISRSTRPSSPGEMSSSPIKKRHSDGNHYYQERRKRWSCAQQHQQRHSRRIAQPDIKHRRGPTLTPKRGNEDDSESLVTTTTTVSAMDSDDQLIMTGFRELRGRARDPSKGQISSRRRTYLLGREMRID